MTMSVLKRLAALLAVLAVLFTMTACYQAPPTVEYSDPSADPGVTDPADEEDEPMPTFPAKEGQLTLSLLLGIISENMKWSEVSAYTHELTENEDGTQHAHFAVANNYGKECDMNVTFNPDTDEITEATLSYGDVSVDILTDNTLVIRTIMVAMKDE